MTVLLSSCIKEYTPDNINNEQKLVAVTEMSAGELVTIDLTSTFSTTLPELEIDHNITIVKIINYETGQSIPEEFRYDKVLGKYKNIDFRPKEGQLYDLHIDVADPDVSIITSSTRIPYASKASNINILNAFEVQSENGKTLQQYEVTLKLEPLINTSTYYHLIPYIITDKNAFPPIQENLEFVRINEGSNASFLTSHIDGILIDEELLNNDNDLTFEVRTKSEFSLGGTSGSYLYFELRTVTEDYYNFHVSLSRQKESNKGPFTLPVTTFSNIENGYGLFGAYSTVLDSFQIE